MLRHDAATARGRDDLKFASPSVAAPTGTGRAVCGGRVFRARPLCTSQAHALRTVRTRRRSDGHTSSAHVLRTYRTTRTPHVLRSVRHCPHILAHVHRLAAARTSPPHGATRGVPGRGTPTFRDLSTRPCLECHFSSKSPLSLNTRLNASSKFKSAPKSQLESSVCNHVCHCVPMCGAGSGPSGFNFRGSSGLVVEPLIERENLATRADWFGGDQEYTILHSKEPSIAIRSPIFGISKASNTDLIHKPLHGIFIRDG